MKSSPSVKPQRPPARIDVAFTKPPAGGPASAAADMSDASVRRASGRGWDEWFSLLDKAGAHRLPHREIAAFLYDEHAAPAWWGQMITVAYERARGLRVKHQKCDGSFSASASKTVAVALPRLYAAWAEDSRRARWLPDARLHVRKATENKSMRITWDGGPSSLSVNFYAKGTDKSQVALDHDNLPDIEAVHRMKEFWQAALERLKTLLEGSSQPKPAPPARAQSLF